MSITRRNLLHGLASLPALMSLPLVSKSASLTSADKVLLQDIRKRARWIGGGRQGDSRWPLSRIRVHNSYFDRMSLSHVDGIPVETFHEERRESRYITYYRLEYGEGAAGSSWSLPEDYMDQAIQMELTRR